MKLYEKILQCPAWGFNPVGMAFIDDDSDAGTKKINPEFEKKMLELYRGMD